MSKHRAHSHLHSDFAESPEALLKQSGLKLTVARKAVLEVLLKNHGPLTIDQLAKSVRGSKCDLVTVYRIVEALEEKRLINRCDFGDGVARYEFNPADGSHHHHHVICRGCESVEPLDLCVVQSWERSLQDRGYSDLTHKLEFFGLCKRCKPASAGVKREALL